MKLIKALPVVLVLVLIVGVFSCAQADDLQPKAALAVSPKKKTVNVGDELQLSVNTDQPVAWSSGNSAKASVDQNGLVTAVRKGNVTITAMSENGKKAGCRLTIKQPMLELKLNKAQLGLAKGAKQKLKASIVPFDSSDRKLSWSSSNKKVATVSKSGVVTGKGKGQALITAKSKNGLKAQCTVAVAKDKKKIKSSDLQVPDYATVPVGIEDVKFTAYGVKVDFPNLSRQEVEQVFPGGEWKKISTSGVPSGYELWSYQVKDMSFSYSRKNKREALVSWSVGDAEYMHSGVVGTLYDGAIFTNRGVSFGNTLEDFLDVYGMPSYVGWQVGHSGPSDVPTYKMDIFQYFINVPKEERKEYQLQFGFDQITHKLIYIIVSGLDPLR